MVDFQRGIQFELLRHLQQTPEVSQRALAKDLGVGLGAINFCFQAFVKKGLVKMHNLSLSKNMLRFAYLLTSAGMAEKSKLTAGFLRRKVLEYETLQAEIKALKSELEFDRYAAKGRHVP